MDIGEPTDLPRDPLAAIDVRERRESFTGLSGESAGIVRDYSPGQLRDDLGVLQILEATTTQEAKAAPQNLVQEQLPPAVQVETLAVKLDDEERELWRQLRRKSEFELRVAEKRALLTETRDKRRSVSSAFADVRQSIDNLKGQVEFTMMHERELEHDISVLKESNRILQTAFQERKLRREEQENQLQHGHLPHHLSKNEKDAIKQKARVQANIIEQKREHDAVVEYEEIAHLRAHLERVVAEKNSLQQRQQALLEKQHASEQDRNLLLSSLQEERKGINDLRQERLRVWEERHRMEREMTTIVQDSHFRLQKEQGSQRYRGGGVDPSIIAAEENAHLPDPFAQDAIVGKSILSGGVRVPATLDTPVAFDSKTDDMFTWKDGRKEPPGASRKHWTNFSGDAMQRSSSGVVDSGGAGFGMTSAMQAMEGPTNSGITEWAPRLQEYRAHGQTFK